MTKNKDNNLLKQVIQTEILKQQTRFNLGWVMIWNIHELDNKYYLVVDEKEMFDCSTKQFNNFKDMTGE